MTIIKYSLQKSLKAIYRLHTVRLPNVLKKINKNRLPNLDLRINLYFDQNVFQSTAKKIQ